MLDVATGILAARDGLDVEAARARLLDAAVRAGISVAQAALVLINVAPRLTRAGVDRGTQA